MSLGDNRRPVGALLIKCDPNWSDEKFIRCGLYNQYCGECRFALILSRDQSVKRDDHVNVVPKSLVSDTRISSLYSKAAFAPYKDSLYMPITTLELNQSQVRSLLYTSGACNIEVSEQTVLQYAMGGIGSLREQDDKSYMKPRVCKCTRIQDRFALQSEPKDAVMPSVRFSTHDLAGDVFERVDGYNRWDSIFRHDMTDSELGLITSNFSFMYKRGGSEVPLEHDGYRFPVLPM